MKTKHCLITGGTSGLGLEFVKIFIKKDFFIHIISRNEEKFKYQINKLPKKTKSKIFFYKTDLFDVESVNKTIKKLKKIKNIDFLINNAGIISLEKEMNVNNMEKTLMVNYLSHFFITYSLRKNILKAKNGKIINISSVVHKFAFLNMKDLNMETFYNGWIAYFNSKLMILLFTYKLNLIFKDIQSFAIHPGWIKTNFGNNNENIIRKFLSQIRSIFAKNPDAVAKRIFKLVTSNNVDKKDCYFSIDKVRKSSDRSLDRRLQNELWKKSIKFFNEYVS
tara:strand:+ start:102 stop:935 length:834 start_codon:yes stop_codon:yes gene_type:complete